MQGDEDIRAIVVEHMKRWPKTLTPQVLLARMDALAREVALRAQQDAEQRAMKATHEAFKALLLVKDYAKDKEAAEEQATRMAVELGATIAHAKMVEAERDILRLRLADEKRRGERLEARVSESQAATAAALANFRAAEEGYHRQLAEAASALETFGAHGSECGLDKSTQPWTPVDTCTCGFADVLAQAQSCRPAALVDQKSPETPPG